MKTIFCFLMLITVAAPAFAADSKAKILLNEYQNLKKFVASVTPNGKIGGVMYSYKKNGYEILWNPPEKEGDSDVIKIYREHTDGTDDFVISYIKAKHIVPGKWVLRRFVGPVLYGWRNDTVDLETMSYLGRQGAETPYMDKKDLKLISTWGITLF